MTVGGSYIVSMKYSQGLFSNATWKLCRLADRPTGTALRLRPMLCIVSISILWYLACCCVPADIIDGIDAPPPLDELTLLDCRFADPPESELGALLKIGSLPRPLLPDNTRVLKYSVSKYWSNSFINLPLYWLWPSGDEDFDDFDDFEDLYRDGDPLLS